jgi:hypothetical protein
MGLSMKTFCSKLLLGAAASLAMSASAQAAITISQNVGGPDPGPPPGYSVVLDYDGINTGFFAQAGNFIVIDAPGIPNTAAAPLGTAPGTNFAFAGTGAYAELTAAAIRGFSLYLGSIDGFNHIAFFDGATQLAEFDGNALAPPANGNQSSALTNRRITFDFGGASATRVVIFSEGQVTEWDTIAVPTAVPEPATWAMMITGFGLLGAALRRRRQLGAVVA